MFRKTPKMAPVSSYKLKDPRVCRVFVSSPFGGYEKEREELVLKYFPQLSHLCQGRGVQFVAVDMRWGITEEAATDAQVVSICLREVDRSDIFIGFYGQRYGWHGAKDPMLQKNIDNAKKRYPWLTKVKDRSVTEMEFLHGHLNSPGALPSIMAFRSKSYDDQKRKKAEEKKNSREATKFTVESSEANKLLTSLKEQVASTKAKCVAFNDDYKTPEEGAKFVFENLKDLIEKMVSVKTNISKRDLDLANHDMYRANRESIYVGTEDKLKQLDLAVTKGQHAMIIGTGGSGKAALLARWLTTQKKRARPGLIYHFVGCATDSAAVPEIVRRLTVELQHLSGEKTKSRSEQLSEMDESFSTSALDLGEQCRQLDVLLTKVATKSKVILAIDGLGKVNTASRTAKPLFWLPACTSSNVTIIGTCRDSDKEVIDELMSRGFTKITLEDLNKQHREELSKQLLKHNSKELSTSQMKKLVDDKDTGNPLYLKTCITELCAFGRFRELDEKIDELMACDSVQELFQSFIRRLEADYITDTKRGNIVEQVLCSICVSREGLSEGELMAMHSIPSHEWSPLFFAMQDVITEMAGLLRFGFNELREAVESRYLKDKMTKFKYQKIIANYFDEQRKSCSDDLKLDDPTLTRPALELPWLLREMKDMKKLTEVLSDLQIFSRLFLDQEYELVDLWRSTGMTGDDIAKLYLTAIEAKGKDLASKLKDSSQLKAMIYITLLPYLGALSYFLEMGHYQSAQERVLNAQLGIMEDSMASSDTLKKRNIGVVKLKLAYLYSDTGRYEQAHALHQEVLASREEILKAAETKQEKENAIKGLGQSYHGIAMLHSKMGNTERAIEFYTKAMESQKEVQNSGDVADSLHNLGVMYMKLNNYEKALELCSKSMKIYEEIYFTNLPPVIGVMLGNIAVCHRNLGQVDEAEKMYKKAIEISERALGRCHPNVGLALMNLGTLEVNRKRFAEAEGCLRECKDILESTESDGMNKDYFTCLEKFVFVLLKVNKGKEALPLFKTMYAMALKENILNKCWPVVYAEMVDWLIQEKDFSFAHDVTLSLFKAGGAQEKSYMQYDTICKALKKKPDPKYDMDKAFQGKPKSLIMVRNMIETKLIPSGDVKGVNNVLDEVDSDRMIGPDLYGTAVMWCEEAKKSDMALGVLEHAVSKFPTEANFVASLAQKFYDRQEWSKALEWGEKMIKLEPDTPNHYLMVGDVCLRTKNLSRGKEIFIKMNEKFASMDSVVSQSKAALEMIKKLESVNK